MNTETERFNRHMDQMHATAVDAVSRAFHTGLAVGFVLGTTLALGAVAWVLR